MTRFSLRRFGIISAWSFEIAAAVLWLCVGLCLMPVLIYFGGVLTLGRYEGASLGHLFSSLFLGLKTGSTASWIVIFGPYGIYLLFKGLRAWWRAGLSPA